MTNFPTHFLSFFLLLFRFQSTLPRFWNGELIHGSPRNRLPTHTPISTSTPNCFTKWTFIYWIWPHANFFKQFIFFFPLKLFIASLHTNLKSSLTLVHGLIPWWVPAKWCLYLLIPLKHLSLQNLHFIYLSRNFNNMLPYKIFSWKLQLWETHIKIKIK